MAFWLHGCYLTISIIFSVSRNYQWYCFQNLYLAKHQNNLNMSHENNYQPIHKRYELLLSRITERELQVQEFINMLHNQTTWLTSPASTKYHLNIEGGLLQPSVDSDWGSLVKNETGYRLNDLFGHSKHAARFLKSKRYPVKYAKNNIYVKAAAA